MQSKTDIEGGKYTIVHNNGTDFHVLRNGEPWIRYGENQPTKLLLACSAEIDALRTEVGMLKTVQDRIFVENIELREEKVIVAVTHCYNDFDTHSDTVSMVVAKQHLRAFLGETLVKINAHSLEQRMHGQPATATIAEVLETTATGQAWYSAQFDLEDEDGNEYDNSDNFYTVQVTPLVLWTPTAKD